MAETMSSGTPLVTESCLAVVLGTHEWSPRARRSPAPSFLNSAKGVIDYCTSARGLGIPDGNLLNLFGTGTTAEDQLTELRNFIEVRKQAAEVDNSKITDLVVWCISHGVFSSGNRRDLHLMVKTTDEAYIARTAISFSDLAAVIHKEAPLQRRFIVIDCCYAGAALKEFMSTVGAALTNAAVAGVEAAAHTIGDPAREMVENGSQSSDNEVIHEIGTLLLCSSSQREESIADDGTGRTLFTGSVLRVLCETPGKGKGPISFAELRAFAFGEMVAMHGSNAPYPSLYGPRQDQGDLCAARILPLYSTSTNASLLEPTIVAGPAVPSAPRNIESQDKIPAAVQPKRRGSAKAATIIGLTGFIIIGLYVFFIEQFSILQMLIFAAFVIPVISYFLWELQQKHWRDMNIQRLLLDKEHAFFTANRLEHEGARSILLSDDDHRQLAVVDPYHVKRVAYDAMREWRAEPKFGQQGQLVGFEFTISTADRARPTIFFYIRSSDARVSRVWVDTISAHVNG